MSTIPEASANLLEKKLMLQVLIYSHPFVQTEEEEEEEEIEERCVLIASWRNSRITIYSFERSKV